MIEKIAENIVLKSQNEVILVEKREVVNLTVTTEGDMKKSIYDSDNDGVVDFAKDLDISYEEWTQFDLILSTI